MQCASTISLLLRFFGVRNVKLHCPHALQYAKVVWPDTPLSERLSGRSTPRSAAQKTFVLRWQCVPLESTTNAATTAHGVKCQIQM
jgi:hypothetical protein